MPLASRKAFSSTKHVSVAIIGLFILDGARSDLPVRKQPYNKLKASPEWNLPSIEQAEPDLFGSTNRDSQQVLYKGVGYTEV
jgi:hypothetical protein